MDPPPRTILHVEEDSVAPSQQIVKGRTKVIKLKSGKPHITSKLVGDITMYVAYLDHSSATNKDPQILPWTRRADSCPG
jgi:hypothetical protein